MKKDFFSHSASLIWYASEIATSKPAWLSYMLHIGGLTLCDDAKKLRIPNLVAAERFGNATLARLGLRLGDVDLAFQNIINTGDIRQALLLYRQMIWMRDAHVDDLKKTEEQHRDSFYVSFLGNCHPSLRKLEIEAKITKPSKTPGRIDMLITVPSAKRILVLEWKVLHLDFLDFGTRMTPEEKADHLKGIVEVRDILNLKFARHDLFRPGRTIKDWILEGDIRDTQDNKDNKKKVSPCQQLADYIASPEIAQLKMNHTVTAYLVVVVGSRQIVCWKMDNGQLRDEDVQLAA
ncbi:hypothetical protein B0O80DRAFT_504814 [Mortierella sp. GBAus27b]|nr:hypothetical protein B0O80DRAFT_504814 [Mortierella sp. GBAus27b]